MRAAVAMLTTIASISSLPQQPIRSDCCRKKQSIITDYWARVRYRGGPIPKCGSCVRAARLVGILARQIDLRVRKIVRKLFACTKQQLLKFSTFGSKLIRSTHIYKNPKSTASREVAGTQPMYLTVSLICRPCADRAGE